MNFFGLNRAALNGGVSNVIAGAAIMTAIASVTAVGTRTQLPSAAVSVSGGSVAADGLRMAMASATASSSSTGSAQWSILTTANVDIAATSSMRATPTTVYIPIALNVFADGFITRPGAGSSISTSSGLATPLVTVGYTSSIAASSSMLADASVKLNGQSTIQRDGYVLPMSGLSSMVPTPLKTAMGIAVVGGFSDSSATAVRIAGGAALSASSASLAATPSVDQVTCVSHSEMSATGAVFKYGEARITAATSMTADAVGITQGYAQPFSAFSDCTADGKPAGRGAADIVVTSDFRVEARLALLGQSSIPATSDMTAKSITFRPAFVQFTGSSDVEAQWVVIVSGSATISANSSMAAEAYTNAESYDPPERTMYRPASNRNMSRPFVDKEMRRSA